MSNSQPKPEDTFYQLHCEFRGESWRRIINLATGRIYDQGIPLHKVPGRRSGKKKAIPKKELKLLHHLYRNRGNYCRYKDLMDALGSGIWCRSRVQALVGKLRKHLGENGQHPERILTKANHGYGFFPRKGDPDAEIPEDRPDLAGDMPDGDWRPVSSAIEADDTGDKQATEYKKTNRYISLSFIYASWYLLRQRGQDSRDMAKAVRMYWDWLSDSAKEMIAFAVAWYMHHDKIPEYGIWRAKVRHLEGFEEAVQRYAKKWGAQFPPKTEGDTRNAFSLESIIGQHPGLKKSSFNDPLDQMHDVPKEGEGVEGPHGDGRPSNEKHEVTTH